jgi:glycosyltransferase involved in cell wall biosynthesis
MRWLIVEDALRNQKGHWFEAVTTFYSGFREMGDQVTVLADASVESGIRESLAAVPILPPSIWHRQGDGAGRVTRYSRVLVHPWQTWRVMRRYFATHRQFDAVFVPSMGFHHLLAWAWLIKKVLRNRPTRVLLFFLILPIRWDSHTGSPVPDGSPTSRLFFRILKWLAPEIRSGKVVLGAEIEPIRAALESLSGVPATLFPQIVIPIRNSGPATLRSQEGIEMGCYGPSRAEKGSDVLQEAVAIHRRRFPHSRSRFTIHWTEDFVADGTRRVTRLPNLLRDPHVEYLTRFLSHSEYEEQLRRTQVMLLPYRLASYRLRGSRVVVEAIVNGIPVIATRGTALAGVVESSGAGLFCEDGDPESLATSIREMEMRHDEIKLEAQEKARRAVQESSVEAFRQVFSGSAPAARPPVTRVC